MAAARAERWQAITEGRAHRKNVATRLFLQSVPQMVRIVTESVLYLLEISKKQASIKGCKGSKELWASQEVRRFDALFGFDALFAGAH